MLFITNEGGRKLCLLLEKRKKVLRQTRGERKFFFRKHLPRKLGRDMGGNRRQEGGKKGPTNENQGGNNDKKVDGASKILQGEENCPISRRT